MTDTYTPPDSRRCPICGECLTESDGVWECATCGNTEEKAESCET